MLWSTAHQPYIDRQQHKQLRDPKGMKTSGPQPTRGQPTPTVVRAYDRIQGRRQISQLQPERPLSAATTAQPRCETMPPCLRSTCAAAPPNPKTAQPFPPRLRA